jgi:predicted O-methyltransferase YrrM
MDTIEALKYITRNNIPGDFIECGVQSGRQQINFCRYSLQNNLPLRNLYLYDTFEGMARPTPNDRLCDDYPLEGMPSEFRSNKGVIDMWSSNVISENANGWCRTDIESVKRNISSTGYPNDMIHYIKGNVFDTLTLESNLPQKIAILRLDTDWYDSSKFELEILYDRVVPGGVVIFDDYFLWNGQRRATDEFFQQRNININISRYNSQIASIIVPSNTYINIFAEFDVNLATPLCEIMEVYGSDKGNISNGSGRDWHNYTKYYNAIFSKLRHAPLRLFELGLGTNNVKLPSNMGENGKPGASLFGWRKYFSKGTIFGADIDKSILFHDDRISTFYCDQTTPNIIHDLWENIELKDNFDIIIDDGLHEFYANKCFFENSIHKLNPNGVFIIEDVLLKDIVLYESQINDWKFMYPNLIFRVINIPHHLNIYDNCLIVVQNKA